MTQSTTLVGPRGWAALTLAGGSVLAIPFLRPAHTTPQADSQQVTVAQPLNGNSVGGDRDQTQSIHDVTSNSVLPGRQIHGTLPATGELAPLNEVSHLSVPDWAQRQSKLEALMARDAAASIPEVSIPEVSLKGRPTTSIVGMRPWTSDGSRLASPEPGSRVLRPVLPPQISNGGNNLAVRAGPSRNVPSGNVIVRQTAAPSGMQSVTMPAPVGPRDSGFAPSRGVRPAVEVLQTPSSVESGLVLPDASVQNVGSVANPPRKPNFVFQPGMRRE